MEDINNALFSLVVQLHLKSPDFNDLLEKIKGLLDQGARPDIIMHGEGFFYLCPN